MVHHRDVREAAHRPFKRCTGHKQEVCGLKWSGDGGPQAATLASGGNDNKVCIWDLRGSRRAAVWVDGLLLGLGGGGGGIRVGVRGRMGRVEMRRCGSSMSILRLLRRLLGIRMCRVCWLLGVGRRTSI
jgi:hypothetical protein